MVINLFIFLAVMFLLTFLLGKIIEKFRVPWIFAALLLGSLLAIYNPFKSITSSSEFNFLANLGMYFLLFIIGFELNLKKLKQQKKFIFKATFFIILFEALFGSMIVHFVFNYNWFISVVVALSFATVGEAILVPILDEFKIINTKLGQTIIGIATLDDIFEVLTLILAMFLVGKSLSVSSANSFAIILSLLALFTLAYGLTKLKKHDGRFSFLSIEMLFVFILFILFLFLGIGEFAHASAIAALLSGIALKNFLPRSRLKLVESEIKTMCYGFFAPVFFLWVGASMDIKYLISYPLLILLIVIVSKSAKLLSSWYIGRKELGSKQSLLLGIGLSVRFSTSIIITKILLENNIIGLGIYSVIIASSIVFKFLVPVLFSNLLVKWGIAKNERI